jgi:hypothetical protein
MAVRVGRIEGEVAEIARRRSDALGDPSSEPERR